MADTDLETEPRRNWSGGGHEVVVVGARCAGAATALLLARQGHDVLVVDRVSFPSDTLSTHAIARGGVVQLARWGLLDAVVDSGAPPIRTVTFHFGDGSVMRRTVKDRAGVDLLVAPRRHVLDPILLSAAIEDGAEYAGGLTVTGVATDRSGRVLGVEARARNGRRLRIPAAFVVGADGVHSRIARAVGARVVDQRPSDAGTHYTYVAGLDWEGFEFHVGPGAFAGVFPTHGGEANVWVCCPAAVALPDTTDTTYTTDTTGPAPGARRTAAFLSLLERAAPSLAERVRAARITAPVRSAARLPNHVRAAAGRGWALVGDAGYHRDPITGHGITDAFRDAELLAGQLGRALRGELSEREALRSYAHQRDRALAPIFDVTCQLAAFPPADEFAELQKQLSVLLDEEATELAALPPIHAAEAVVA
jgi:2-polyprenyl-6-methoxyphenol hydroxylase-like FAD-dependent oxidoreductase